MNKPSVSAGVVAGVALGAAALGAAAVAVRAACPREPAMDWRV